jgi:hypothetical protein
LLFLIFQATPDESVIDTKSAVKNAESSIKTDVALDVSSKVIKQTGTQAVDNSCNNPNSTFCDTARFGYAMITIAFTILVIGLIIGGLYGFVKWIIKIFESF